MFYVHFERGRHDVDGPTFGPFPFVQMTYSGLRVGPEGDWLAYHMKESDEWEIEGAIEPFSDVIIADQPDPGATVYPTAEAWTGTAEAEARDAAAAWVKWDAELNEEPAPPITA